MLYQKYLEPHRGNNVDKGIQGESRSQKEGCNFISSRKSKHIGKAQFDNYIRNVDAIIEQVKSKVDVYLEEDVHICDEDSEFDVHIYVHLFKLYLCNICFVWVLAFLWKYCGRLPFEVCYCSHQRMTFSKRCDF